jgi:RNA polymerase sigma factor (TIGR02999 family)
MNERFNTDLCVCELLCGVALSFERIGARIPVRFGIELPSASLVCENSEKSAKHILQIFFPFFFRMPGMKMCAQEQSELTAILSDVHAGVTGSKERLILAIYGEMLRVARRMMRRERPDHTLEPSALVHEALIRLFGKENLPGIPSSSELLASAAKAMAQVLVEHARRRNARKRGGRRSRVPLDQVLEGIEEQGLDVLDLHQALERLSRSHPRQAQVVELRFFCRMTISEVAGALGVSDTAVETDWRFARAWLRRHLGGSER